MYALRTASVVEVDPYWPSGFVFIRTVTNERGNPADQKTAKGRYRAPSRVSQSLWHEYWEPA
jgi:hypothetical protein